MECVSCHSSSPKVSPSPWRPSLSSRILGWLNTHVEMQDFLDMAVAVHDEFSATGITKRPDAEAYYDVASSRLTAAMERHRRRVPSSNSSAVESIVALVQAMAFGTSPVARQAWASVDMVGWAVRLEAVWMTTSSLTRFSTLSPLGQSTPSWSSWWIAPVEMPPGGNGAVCVRSSTERSCGVAWPDCDARSLTGLEECAPGVVSVLTVSMERLHAS